MDLGLGHAGVSALGSAGSRVGQDLHTCHNLGIQRLGLLLGWGLCMVCSSYGAAASPHSGTPCPHAILFLPWQTNVSTARLERYLSGEDLDTSAIHHNPIAGRQTSRSLPVGHRLAQTWAFSALRIGSLLAGNAVRFSEATFSWHQDGSAAIRE